MKPEEVVRAEIDRLLKEAKLTVADKSDLYALCGYMADQDNETPYNHFLLMYLSKDRDWKKDFISVFGQSRKKRSGEKFDLSAVRAAKIKKR